MGFRKGYIGNSQVAERELACGKPTPAGQHRMEEALQEPSRQALLGSLPSATLNSNWAEVQSLRGICYDSLPRAGLSLGITLNRKGRGSKVLSGSSAS